MWRRLVIGMMMVPATLHAAPPEKQECVDAATRGQIQRDDGKLKSATESFARCATDACPTVVRESCATWLAEVRERTPRLIVRLAPSGQVGDVVVRVDGEPALAETPLSLDPGPHAVRVEPRVGPPRALQVTLTERQERTLVMQVGVEPTAAPAAPEERPVPAAVWILGAVAAVGVASFTFFGLRARADVERMQSDCAPGCATADRDRVFRTAVAADVSLGIGLVAAAGATILFFARPARPR